MLNFFIIIFSLSIGDVVYLLFPLNQIVEKIILTIKKINILNIFSSKKKEHEGISPN